MARRWLLTVLTGTALGLGFAGTAGAQELDPVTVDAEVVEVTATADTSERTLEAELTTDVTVEEADTEVSPDATTEASPDGAGLDVEGSTEVVGNELPVPVVSEPVEDAVAPTTERSASGSDVTPVPAPADRASAPAGAAPAGQPATTFSHSRPISADGATARRGMWAETTTYDYDDSGVLAPEVAPPAEALPLVAAAAPTVATDLSLPFIDTTPTVPGLLRLLAGLMVVGAAATWRTVRNELA